MHIPPISSHRYGSIGKERDPELGNDSLKIVIMRRQCAVGRFQMNPSTGPLWSCLKPGINIAANTTGRCTERIPMDGVHLVLVRL